MGINETASRSGGRTLFPGCNPHPARGRDGKCISADVPARFGSNLGASSYPRATTPTMWRRSGASSSSRCWSARSSCGRRWRGRCCPHGGDVPCSFLRPQGHPKTPSLTSPCHCRLELLLQIANKIQNGALSCEEKLTLAKNTLQAVSGG